jgi:perosamine synthetase
VKQATTQTAVTPVPFFRADLQQAEIDEVVAVLQSGWLTTGPRVRRMEQEFAAAVGASHAVAVNSCTAALHLAVECMGLRAGQAVLVPTMTFAATAEVVRYLGATPILVDCDPDTLNMDLTDAEKKLAWAREGKFDGAPREVVGVIPVHVGGHMMDVDAVHAFAEARGLWVVEDAAHAFPAAWRRGSDQPWQRCGNRTAQVSCFSFYANKTITTGEGGMAVTEDAALAERIRLMSLHGLSKDAWSRYSKNASYDYRIIDAGYKYNLTDIAAAIGIHQLARAEEMRLQREQLAVRYTEMLGGLEQVELPPVDGDRLHSWHLYPIKLRLDQLSADRDRIFKDLQDAGVGCSVHWRPLHLHPYYEQRFGWLPEHCPTATREWKRLISLPLFPSMQLREQDYVVSTLQGILHNLRSCSAA